VKICFKCGTQKERAEFYKHPMMGDGLLGKCKECTKKDTKERIARKSLEQPWVDQERERCRIKQEKARENGFGCKTSIGASAKWSKLNRNKKNAHLKVKRAIESGELVRKENCEDCLVEQARHAHHEDYSKPLEVVFLCLKCHGKRHHKTGPIKRRNQ
tara:strand:+ start:87 stop:560 length:474 start_codon:yes stop_codon:yes gene_type:complete